MSYWSHNLRASARAIDVMGLAFATNTVTVNSQTAYRKGEYFRAEVPVSNSATSVWQSVTVAATNQTTVYGNVYVPKNPEHFYYDLDGNLTNDGRWTYTWDAENRLVKLAPNTSIGLRSSLQFEYDWQGRRIRKQVWDNTEWNGDPTNDVKFVYDGWNPIAELDALNASTLLRSYVWGSDLSGSLQGAGGVGGLLAVRDTDSGATAFVAFDGNGNVAALADAGSTNILAHNEYGPFGEVIRATGPMAKANPFRFSTKHQGDETDLVYYGYRYYNASTGRWLSRDRKAENGGLNLYGFVRNAAPGKVDSLGEDAAIVNAGGYLGHTSFIIVDPDGGINAFHYYAAHHGEGPCGIGSVLGFVCDTVDVWAEYYPDLYRYLEVQRELHRGPVTIPAWALGTTEDDDEALAELNALARTDTGVYSVVLGIECHTKSWDWFNLYVVGGRRLEVFPRTPEPTYFPQKWWGTRRWVERQLPQLP